MTHCENGSATTAHSSAAGQVGAPGDSVGRRGHHPVDHGRREGDVAPHPLGQARVPALGQVTDDPRRGPAVAGQVVAGRDRERAVPAARLRTRPSTRTPGSDTAVLDAQGRGRTAARVGSSGPPVAHRAIALLGHGDGDDLTAGSVSRSSGGHPLGRDVDPQISARSGARHPTFVPRGGRRIRCGSTRPARRMTAGRPPRSLPGAARPQDMSAYTAWWARWNAPSPTCTTVADGARVVPGARTGSHRAIGRQEGPVGSAGLVGQHELRCPSPRWRLAAGRRGEHHVHNSSATSSITARPPGCDRR